MRVAILLIVAALWPASAKAQAVPRTLLPSDGAAVRLISPGAGAGVAHGSNPTPVQTGKQDGVRTPWIGLGGLWLGALALGVTAGVLAYQVNSGIGQLDARYAAVGFAPSDFQAARDLHTKRDVAWGLAGGSAALAITSVVLVIRF